MPIRTEEELAAAADLVGRKLQEIQDYLGADSHRAAKVRFPRGFIRTANHFRNRLLFILDRDARDNLAYALILTDVYRWLTNRTDLFGTAREMTFKAGVVLAGSICETMAVNYTTGAIGRSVRFKPRCDRMVTAEMITGPLRDELHWLWDTRSAIHLCDVTVREYERYTTSDYNRSITCIRDLRDQLDEHSTANAAF
jgi:hypothetical protein